MFFTHPTKTQYVGVTVKDADTSGYSFFVYKCSVSGFECEVSCINLCVVLLNCRNNIKLST